MTIESHTVEKEGLSRPKPKGSRNLHAGTTGRDRRGSRQERLSGFTLTELVMTVAIMGIFAVIAVPRFNRLAITRVNAKTEAEKLVRAITKTRSLAILNGATKPDGYKLSLIDSGGQGSSQYTGYEIIDRSGKGTVVDTYTLSNAINISGDKKLEFEILGNLDGNGGDKTITIGIDERMFNITVDKATGFATIEEVE